MAAVWMVARSILGRRWRGLTTVALIVGVAGGVTLAALAGARRTASSFDRFLDSARVHQVLVLDDDIRLSDMPRIRAIPGVAAAGLGRFLSLVDNDGRFFDAGFGVVGVKDRTLLRTINRPRVIAGRLPRSHAAEEIALGESFARHEHLHVGDRFPIRSLTPAQTRTVLQGGDVGHPLGPAVTLHVVGIYRIPPDLTLQAQTGGVLILPAAFVHKYGDRIGNIYGPHGAVLLVRLEHGAAAVPRFLHRLRGVVRDHSFDLDPTALSVGGVRESIDVLAVAILIFGAIAGAAGFVAIGLTSARQVVLGSGELVACRSLGMRRSGRAAAAGLPVLLAIGAGALLAVLAAWGASPLFPFGVAGEAEPNPGMHFDGFVLAVGGLGIFLIAGVIVAVTAWRLARPESSGAASRLRPAATTRAVEALGMGPAVTVGARMALEPGRGRTAVPVRSALLGAAAAVVGVVGVTVFAASLDHLVATPAEQGRAWDALVFDYQAHLPPDGRCGPGDTRVLHQPGLAAIGIACSASINVDERAVGGIAVAPLRGRLEPTVLDGRLPRGEREIALGSETLAQLGRSIGDRVTIRGPRRSPSYRVVGRVVVPRLLDPQAIADGAVLTAAGMNRIGNSREDLSFAVVVRFRPDADAQRVMRRIDHLPDTGRFGQPGVAPTTTPLEIQRFDEVNRMPVVLATFLAVLGAVAVGHLLVTSVRRRRRDFAILKSLGAGRRQLLGVVAWQATIVAGFGVTVGVVAGIACGTALWYGAASSVGVGTGVTVPVAAIAVVAVTAVFIANAVAVVPARSAANTPAAVVLRAE